MIRVRYAPSPTGDPHLGNIRTALFTFLAARSMEGTFIMRVEDTDQARKVEGSVERMLEAMRWLGMVPDEGVYLDDQEAVQQRGEYGPYIQSERLPLYREHAERLIVEGKAYKCFATPEELEAMRADQQAKKLPPRYDRRHRELSEEEIQKREEGGEKYVVRQAMPLEGEVRVLDVVRGELVFQAKELEDHVLLKSDGFPTYQLANVVDDHLMKISHVIRAEEWIPSTPKNVLLYQAFGWEPPLWVHVPMILGPDKAKLSKRHGAEPVLSYRDRGYLPEALVNFLAFLGWNPGTEEEVFTPEQLIKYFTLERVQKSPAVFDQQRLDYLNGWYIRQLMVGEIAERMRPYLQAAGLEPRSDEHLMLGARVLQERFKHFDETAEISWFFFKRPEVNDELRALIVPKKMEIDQVQGYLRAAINELQSVNESDWTQDILTERLFLLISMLGLKNGQVLWPVRAALSGVQASPGAFEMLAVLGKEESLARLQALV